MVACTVQPTPQWEFELRDGDWQPFAVNASAAVEDAFLAASGSGTPAVVRSGRFSYNIDFALMQQTNIDVSSQTCRKIRRTEIYTKASVDTLIEQMTQLQQENERILSQCNQLQEQLSAAQLATSAMVPKSSLWRELQILADRLFALRNHPLSAGCPDVREMNGTQVMVSEIPVTDPRYQWICNQFLSSFESHRFAYSGPRADEWCPPAEIEVLRILELYNQNLVQSYLHELSIIGNKWAAGCESVPELEDCIRVRTDLGGPGLNEVLVYHGSTLKAARDILTEGFDSRLGGMNAGAAYGRGSYFASKASKSDFYSEISPIPFPSTDGSTCHDVRHMFVARVALGCIFEARQYDSDMRRPPLNDAGVRYDSVLGVPRRRGGAVDFGEFVVYKPGQAIPQFAIFYRHQDGCRCQTCVNPRQ